MHFEHAGIATENARELADLYTDLFGIENVHEEEFDGMRIIFLDCGNGYFELLEPLEDGTIAQYLEQNGPGIHHLALRTNDIEGALETAREHDVRLIDEEPRPGAWGHTVAFLHPSDTGGILLELVEH
ncbi:methylmalonyl-CoA epimerase [Natrialba magadii ATCC 43099]|uniref:Methylmalonyl-CoA epimerase n=1 Tax=Natrialba magadii (strain ATCC 43099 / DSM 3394 / CCM 3739 / CIP 104546 / IAM 13178 / JCM 8861 / NBRC 102185 / NCIMB 2190 / MS3) TaxID=547559 RepID=D3SYN1_NATMM|nr:methylmalonyl-CoA epimerase [Natrialba magadii]ADD04142.1 methylmalonyl-CoA epimerase [Natrialba magadii ATCC 43099]ELY32927.1 methylmalonyl-CoA epimerase [Natrialba magadii ATCC 43099]